MLSECSQPFDQSFPGEVPILEHRFESLRCYGFHSYERSLDIGFAHGIQIFTILTCLHGDLGEKHHVLRKSGKLLHQLETFCANRLELLEFGRIVLLACETKVGQAYGVKVIVREGNKAETDAAELNDLVDYGLVRPLPGYLPIGPPHAAKRAVLGAAANGLN